MCIYEARDDTHIGDIKNFTIKGAIALNHLRIRTKVKDASRAEKMFISIILLELENLFLLVHNKRQTFFIVL